MAEIVPIDLPPADSIMGSLLRKLQDVHPERDGWTCTCPSPDHDGKTVRGWVFTREGGEPGFFCDDACDDDALHDVLYPLAAKDLPPPRDPSPLLALALPSTPASIRAQPPPRKYLLIDANTGAGTYVAGKVGLLAAAGGSGKSYALMQLGVSVATGVTWLGSRGWTPVDVGRVLYLAGEEDKDEAERRRHYCARAQGVTSDEQVELLAANLTVLPLTGHGCSLTYSSEGEGELPVTGFWTQVADLLIAAQEEGRPYVLILLDPLSRFAGFDVEKDNAAATRWVQAVEKLGALAGGASVWCAHHVKKRGENDDPDSADLIRGASALVNGVRWAARLEQQKRSEDSADLLTLRIVKANGVPPQLTPLVLCRDSEHEGALRVASNDEVSSHDGVAQMVRSKLQQIEHHQDRIIAAMTPGQVYSRNDLARVCGRKTLTLQAVAELVAAGTLVAAGPGRYAGVMLATGVMSTGTDAGTTGGTDAG